MSDKPPRSSLARTRERYRLLSWLAFAGLVVGALIGFIRGVYVFPGHVIAAVGKGATIGMASSLVLGGLERIVLHQIWRRLPLVLAIVVRVALYTPLAIGLYLMASLLFHPWLPWNLAEPFVVPYLWISAATVVAAMAVFAILGLLGPRVLRNLIAGRYRQPLDEQRIFLFLDLVDSTGIAERIGPIRYRSLLKEFIEELEEPLLEFEGDVYQYVGDEVVVTWPVTDARANSRCIAWHFAVADAVESARARYQDSYSVVPTFRTGIHMGQVVATEIGDRRRQVVYVGDVVNTASRAQAEAKTRRLDLVITGALLSRLQLPAGIEARPLGQVLLKGKEQTVDLFAVFRCDDALMRQSA